MEMIKHPKRGFSYWRNLAVFASVSLTAGLLLTFYGILPVWYANGRAHPPRIPICCASPMDWGMPYEDVSFRSADNILIQGWYIRSQNGAAVILAHGSGGNRTSMLEPGVFLARHGFGVLLLDLRAHGESGGTTLTFGGGDIQAGVLFLKRQADVRKKIGVLGFSLGGLQALQAAAGMEDISAVITDGAAPNMFADVPAPDRLTRWLDSPFQWVAFQFWKLAGVQGPLPVTEAIRRIAPRPILLIAGTLSEYEKDMQRKFFQAAGEGCSLWEVPEAGHIESWTKRKEEYGQRMIAFFDQALR